MDPTQMSIGELADAAGISRRAVRFYVQRELLPAPGGLGRGRHYDQTHLERLRKLQQWQAAGHSLEAIKRILDGQPVETIAPSIPRRRGNLSSALWTRLQIAEGVELHFEMTRRNLTAEELMAVKEAVCSVLGRDAADMENDAREGTS